MTKADCLLIPLLLLLASIEVYGQTNLSPDEPVRLMRNGDVIRMVEDRVKPDVIIANILTSRCNFDIFPPVSWRAIVRGSFGTPCSGGLNKSDWIADRTECRSRLAPVLD